MEKLLYIVYVGGVAASWLHFGGILSEECSFAACDMVMWAIFSTIALILSLFWPILEPLWFLGMLARYLLT